MKLDRATRDGRATYATPRLERFGSVSQLTMAGATGAAEPSEKAPPKPGFNMATGGPGPSDRRLKRNVVRIGTHPLGIGLYLFEYGSEWGDAYGHRRQFGVMADEVQRVLPQAVSVQPNGYMVVDYAMLGIAA